MEDILGRIADKTKSAPAGAESFKLTDRINKMNDDRKEQFMMLCKGDVSQYEVLTRMSIGDQLIKLDKYVSEIEILTKK